MYVSQQVYLVLYDMKATSNFTSPDCHPEEEI